MPPRAKKEVTPEVDPFAPDQEDVPVGDEAQADTNSWAVLGNETDVNSAETNEKDVRVVSNEGDFVLTFKAGKGYDVPWVVVRAATCEQAYDRVIDPKFRELLDKTAEIGSYFAAKEAPKVAPSGNTSQGGSGAQNGSQGRTQGKPASATDGPLGPQYCNHGQKKFWSKFDDAKNEMVQIYFCPAQKGDATKCKNQYVN